MDIDGHLEPQALESRHHPSKRRYSLCYRSRHQLGNGAVRSWKVGKNPTSGFDNFQTGSCESTRPAKSRESSGGFRRYEECSDSDAHFKEGARKGQQEKGRNREAEGEKKGQEYRSYRPKTNSTAVFCCCPPPSSAASTGLQHRPARVSRQTHHRSIVPTTFQDLQPIEPAQHQSLRVPGHTPFQMDFCGCS